MTRISRDDITKLGHLARIGISEEVAGTLAPQLEGILDYVAQLQEVDTEATQTTNQVTGLGDVWREDEVIPSHYSRAALLSNASATQDGYIQVRRVL
ncbi:Asp-tRNA(Asn)/Glu-tRNA(Gln) amidotransferase GatCAB subunit C [Candidatus Saccharibacteria bacterium SW_7_54_9]|nr:MAG: Asp-tRNA(Asn)/Glu-tRNA(Gln) amidotransferase GatCAB subunit C [Candidatus Saccharibacteria bacterium SW_7_54_9]